MRRTKQIVRLGAAVAIGIAMGAWNCAAAPDYQLSVLITMGDPAPGGGAFTNDFEPDTLNNFGTLAFTAEPVQPGEEGIWVKKHGTVQQVVRFGQSAPGTGGSVFGPGEMGNLGLNEWGDIAFAFSLNDFANTWDSGVFSWSHETHSLKPILVPGMPAPGGGHFLGANFYASLNNFGLIGCAGFLDTPGGPKSGSYLHLPWGGLMKLAAAGDPAPGGGTFVSAWTPFINDLGDAVFAANLSTHPSTDTLQYFYKPAGRPIIAIPFPPGVNALGNVGINNRKEIMFGGASVPFPVQVGAGGIYLYRAGVTKLIARVGDAAPGGGVFSCITGANLSGQSTLNNLGDIAFEAAVSDTNGNLLDEAMYFYSGRKGTLTRVAGIGTVVPGGLGTIVSLEQPGTLIFGAPPPPSGVPLCNAALNDLGQISFAASVNDGLVTRGALLVASPQWLGSSVAAAADTAATEQ